MLTITYLQIEVPLTESFVARYISLEATSYFVRPKTAEIQALRKIWAYDTLIYSS